jgi:hypothetical protein
MPPMRRFTLCLALSLLTACGEGSAEPPVDLRPLEEPIAAVAESRRTADHQLGGALEAIRALDTSVGGFRDPATVDEARETWTAVVGTVTAAETDGLRERYIEVARSVDRARQRLHSIREDLEAGWERDVLDAEDEALQAVRGYAEDTDVLVRAVLTHWPTYEAIHGATTEFVDQRWHYRDAQEAADAYELAISGHLSALEIAQVEIAEAREVRDAAAERANAAAERARDVQDSAPDGDGG